jgi:hypothetical protein
LTGSSGEPKRSELLADLRAAERDSAAARDAARVAALAFEAASAAEQAAIHAREAASSAMAAAANAKKASDLAMDAVTMASSTAEGDVARADQAIGWTAAAEGVARQRYQDAQATEADADGG